MGAGYGVDKVKGRERYVSLGVHIWKRTVNNDGREYREREHDRCSEDFYSQNYYSCMLITADSFL
jgi:hypothetical protein